MDAMHVLRQDQLNGYLSQATAGHYQPEEVA